MQARVASVPGGLDVLKAAGFIERDGVLVLDRPDLTLARTVFDRVAVAVQFGLKGSGFPPGIVTQITNDSEFTRAMTHPGLVVLDCFAEW